MSIGKTETKVYFYKNDFNRVCEEIYLNPHIETGGNLFGLWTTEEHVVVHAALGPGEKCKRTNVSFHQDIEYLSRVGTFLNKKFMLCHIGEWHSHHQLSLNKPSSGDSRTIRQNYPNGVKTFLLIIGNIVDNDRVVLSPYFFSENGNTCEKGKFEVLDEDSPFTTNSMIAEKMNEKAETPNHPYFSSPSPNNDQQRSASLSEGSSSANARSEPSTTDTSSNSGKRAETSNHAYCSSPSPNKDQKQSAPEGSGRSQPSTTVIEVMDTGAEDVGANGHSRQSTRRSVSNSNDVSPGAVTRCTESTTLQIRIPPSDYQTNTMSQPTVRSPSERTRTATPPDPAKNPSASNDPSTTNSASTTCTKSDDDSKQTRKEAILEKVFDEIKSKFNDSGIAMERSTNSGAIEMKFKHVDRHWLIRFPQRFPEEPARVFSSYSENFSDVMESSSSKPDFLNNYIDILLAIKRECKFISLNCSSCTRMNVQSLMLSNPTIDLFLTEEGNAMIKELLDKAKNTLPDFRSLKKEMKCDNVWNNAVLEVSFTHSSILWIIKVNSTFPSCPAKIYRKDERKRYGDAIYETYVYYQSEQNSSKDWASTVLQGITRECACAKCKG